MLRARARRAADRLVGRVAGATAERVVVPALAPPASGSPDPYLAGALLCDRLAQGRPLPLARSELRVSSQNGEDGILAEVFRRIGASAEPFFVEFGVEDGSEGNCVFLADVLGWSGVFLEPDPGHFAQLERRYAGNPSVTTVCAAVTPENADDLFARAGAPPEPDLLSVDVDSVDYWIWRAIVRHRPRVVVVEYNAGLGPEDRLTVPADHAEAWGGTDYFGASIAALRALGEAKGYLLVHTDRAGVNAFFVHERFRRHFPDPPLVRGPSYGLRGGSHPPDRTGRELHRDPPV